MVAVRSLAFAGIIGVALLGWPMTGSAASVGTQIETIKKIIELIQVALGLYDQYSEVTGKLDMQNPLPNKAAENLEALAKRAETFHPQEFVQVPELSGDQALSRDKAQRDAARERWQQFLNDDTGEIERLKQRRSSQQVSLHEYRARYEALSKAEDLLDKLVGNVPATAVFGNEVVEAWYRVAVEAKPRMAGIVSDYERIVKEYDRIISRREAKHEAHEVVLGALRAIQGVGGNIEAYEGLPSRSRGSLPNQNQRSRVGEEISKAVWGAGRATIGQARASQTQIGRMRQERARAERQPQQDRSNQNASRSSAPEESGRSSAGGSQGGGRDSSGTTFQYHYP
jgi:hypothetical protein